MMTSGQALVAFTAAAGLLTITPGLDTALVLRTAAVEGSRRALLAGAGVCVGCLSWGLIASAGLGAVFAVSRTAYDVLRVVGACYLVWFGCRMILRKHASLADANDGAQVGNGTVANRESARRWFARGYLTNILNPKVGVFYATFLPQFIPPGVAVVPFSVLLASIHAAEGVLWVSALTAATRQVAGFLRRRWVAASLDRVTGAILIGFGLKLAFEPRT